MTVHELTPTEARRIAVRAQLFDAARPDTMLDAVRGLTLLQHDPTSAVAPNAELVLWSRLGGAAFSRSELADALERRVLVEHRGMIRPAEDLALYRADMAEWPGTGDVPAWRLQQAEWAAANDGLRRDILARIDETGPITAREVPDTAVEPWQSSGWNNNRNVVMLIAIMERRGEVVCVGRRGRDRLWDLAADVLPDEPFPPAEQARRLRDQKRLRSLGLARARTQETPVEPDDVAQAGEPAVVQGVRGEWRVDPAQLGRRFRGRAALLSPLDRLVFDRTRMTDLFGFDYQLEMYKPAAKRRWGYWALPILYGDRLVGKLDAAVDRKAGVLRVKDLHQDVEFSRAMSDAIEAEIVDLAFWLDVELVRDR